MAPSPLVRSRVLAVPKKGAERDEYEDAASVRTETWPVRAGVADGATESMFSRAWAEILVEGLCARPPTPEAFAEALPSWRASWASNVAAPAEDDPWYTVAKAEEGAFSTLLALELAPSGEWRALRVGDPVLFHLHGTRIERAWPHSDPSDFSTRPALVSSRTQTESTFPEVCRTATGRWRPGDTFLLATDAVAAWLLKGIESEPCPAPGAVRDWDLEAFRTAVTEARAADQLRNDDSTLLILRVPPPSAVDGDAAAP